MAAVDKWTAETAGGRMEDRGYFFLSPFCCACIQISTDVFFTGFGFAF
jgi:hypothetical protein